MFSVDKLETIGFTGELIGFKLHEIHELNGQSDVDTDQVLRAHCRDLGELALDRGLFELQTEADRVNRTLELHNDAREAFQETIRSFSGALTDIMPFAAERLAAETKRQTEAVKKIDLDESELAYVDKLTGILSVLGMPIRNDRAINYLLDYSRETPVDSQEYKIILPEEHKPFLTITDALNYLTEETPRSRMIEYFTSCVGYPITKRNLRAAAFVNGLTKQSDTQKQQKIFGLMLNPAQPTGRPTHNLLKKAGICIQHGRVKPYGDGDAPNEPAIRSIRVDDYQSGVDDGNFTDGVYQYSWNPITTHTDKLNEAA